MKTPYSVVRQMVGAGKPTGKIISKLIKQFPTRDSSKLRREVYSLAYRFRNQVEHQPAQPTRPQINYPDNDWIDDGQGGVRMSDAYFQRCLKASNQTKCLA